MSLKCYICNTSTDDPLNLGEFKTYENITVHYFCVLLSMTITQSGSDEEGILGFLPSDIIEESQRSVTRICSYCNNNGATIKCYYNKCKILFHLPCGLKNHTGHQFLDEFYSFCKKHRLKQKVQMPNTNKTCPICYDDVNCNLRNRDKILWAPCCKKSFFHKPCVQKLGINAGYFFKCPVCNDKDLFTKTMRRLGVFVPDQDATWELEPNAYGDLQYRHNKCDAKICKCGNGRTFKSNAWGIILCESCGSQGTHKICSDVTNNSWICNVCDVINAPSSSKVNKNSEIVISGSINERIRKRFQKEMSSSESSDDDSNNIHPQFIISNPNFQEEEKNSLKFPQIKTEIENVIELSSESDQEFSEIQGKIKREILITKEKERKNVKKIKLQSSAFQYEQAGSGTSVSIMNSNNVYIIKDYKICKEKDDDIVIID